MQTRCARNENCGLQQVPLSDRKGRERCSAVQVDPDQKGREWQLKFNTCTNRWNTPKMARRKWVSRAGKKKEKWTKMTLADAVRRKGKRPPRKIVHSEETVSTPKPDPTVLYYARSQSSDTSLPCRVAIEPAQSHYETFVAGVEMERFFNRQKNSQILSPMKGPADCSVRGHSQRTRYRNARPLAVAGTEEDKYKRNEREKKVTSCTQQKVC